MCTHVCVCACVCVCVFVSVFFECPDVRSHFCMENQHSSEFIRVTCFVCIWCLLHARFPKSIAHSLHKHVWATGSADTNAAGDLKVHTRLFNMQFYQLRCITCHSFLSQECRVYSPQSCAELRYVQST
jgi:hypothetical protein